MGREEAECVTKNRVVLGLGSNLGARGDTITRAISAVTAWQDVILVAQSFVYETPPAGGPPQPNYWNAAVLLLTSNDLPTLLEWALELELKLGRVRPDPVRWGPRTIDIDILWAETCVLQEPWLEIPHPRLIERVFALRPLLDVVPDAKDPRTGELYADLPTANLPIVRIDSR